MSYRPAVPASRERARQLALALPEAVEQDHHGRPFFRVAGRIFATQGDEDHMNVMLDEDGILTAQQARELPRFGRASVSGTQIHPSCCSAVFMDQSAESVASVELVWRVRTDES